MTRFVSWMKWVDGRGRVEPTGPRLVVEWATLHQAELGHIWRQARDHEPLDTIEPLG